MLFLMLYIGAGCLALVAAGRLRPVRHLLYICPAAVRPLAARQLCRPGAQGGVAESHVRPRALRHLHALHVEHGRPRPRVSLAGAHRGHRGVPPLARRDAAGAGVERISGRFAQNYRKDSSCKLQRFLAEGLIIFETDFLKILSEATQKNERRQENRNTRRQEYDDN